MSRSEIFEEHCQWARIHADPLLEARKESGGGGARSGYSGRRIRIGYVSSDLWGGHPIGHILKAILTRHNRDVFSICCYNGTQTNDQLSRSLRDLAEIWRDVRDLSDEDLGSRIMADNVDVLIDLSGHTRNNRLGMSARRPAGVQVTCLGYLNTTGMRAMDWRIAAKGGESKDSQQFHSERLWLHDGLPWPWNGPGAEVPDVGIDGASGSEHVLASFNAFHKLNSRVLEVWGQVLQELPETSLRIFGVPVGESVDRIVGELENSGIDPDRIEVFGKLDYLSYLNECQKVMIALDPFPYNGGATTCECLWMGTPVVSLEGLQGFSRTGASILSAIGFQDLVCPSVAEYKETIRQIVRNPSHPYRSRGFVRARAREGFHRESARFIPEFERAILEMLRLDSREAFR